VGRTYMAIQSKLVWKCLQSCSFLVKACIAISVSLRSSTRMVIGSGEDTRWSRGVGVPRFSGDGDAVSAIGSRETLSKVDNCH
jgi:hypothetical protein